MIDSAFRNLSLAKIVLFSRISRNRPFILSHLITNRCPLNCATCLWKLQGNRQEEDSGLETSELSTNEIERLYQEASQAGFISLVLWGGEPFLRPDLGHLLKFAQQQGLLTFIITNGYLLPQSAEEICPHTDTLLVSIDAPSEYHDQIRGVRGTFERAVRGIEIVKSHFTQVKIILITVLSRLNVNCIEELIQFSKEMALPITFQSMNLTDYGFVNRKIEAHKLQLTPAQEREVFHLIRSYKQRGYAITNSPYYLDAFQIGNKNYTCHYKKVVFRVESNGDVLDCTGFKKVLANVRSKPLNKILSDRNYRTFLKKAERCSRCLDSGTMECSYLWKLKPGALWNVLKMSPV